MNVAAKYSGVVVEIKKDIPDRNNFKKGNRVLLEKVEIHYKEKVIVYSVQDDDTKYVLYYTHNTPDKALKEYFKLIY